MDKTEILVRLKTAVFALKEAEKVAREGASDHADRISEVRFLLEALYTEIYTTEDPAQNPARRQFRAPEIQ